MDCYNCKNKAKNGFINSLCLNCKRQYPGQEAEDRKPDLYQPIASQDEDTDYKPGCPIAYNIPPDMAYNRSSDCLESRCAWWCEDAQKCAILVMAETQRKAVKK